MRMRFTAFSISRSYCREEISPSILCFTLDPMSMVPSSVSASIPPNEPTAEAVLLIILSMSLLPTTKADNFVLVREIPFAVVKVANGFAMSSFVIN